MNKFSKTALSFILFATIISCGNDDEGTSSSQLEFDNLNSGLTEHTDLSLFEEAKTIVGNYDIDRIFTGELSGSYTVFVPTNSAWETYLKDNGYSTISDIPKKNLTMILNYHTLNGKYFVEDFSTQYIHKSFGKINYKDIANSDYIEGPWEGGDEQLELFTNTNSGVLINGSSRIEQGNIFASNTKFDPTDAFIMHKVDKVIDFPTVETMISSDPDLSTFNELVNKDANVGEIFSEIKSQNPFTLYAPNNDAFKAAYTEFSSTDLNGLIASTTNVKFFAENHVEINTSKEDLDFPQTMDVFNGTTMNAGTLEFTRNATSSNVDIKDEKGRISTVLVPKDKDGVANGYYINTMNGSIYKVSKILLK